VLAAGAVQGLLEGVGGHEAEAGRNSGREPDGADAAARLPGDVVEVGGVPADDDAEADDHVDRAGRGQLAGGDGDLEAPRHPDDGHVLVGAAVAGEGVERGGEQPRADQVVEAGDHDAAAHAAGVERALEDPHPAGF
jgi:hypothetical protein